MLDHVVKKVLLASSVGFMLPGSSEGWQSVGSGARAWMIVNLNRHRKSRERAEAERHAAENRIRFGRSKAARQKELQERDRARKELASKELE